MIIISLLIEIMENENIFIYQTEYIIKYNNIIIL